jgi:hypothetical protein
MSELICIISPYYSDNIPVVCYLKNFAQYLKKYHSHTPCLDIDVKNIFKRIIEHQDKFFDYRNSWGSTWLDILINQEMYNHFKQKSRTELVAKELTGFFYQDIVVEFLQDCTAEEEQEIVKAFEENALSLMPEYFDYEYYQENPEEEFYLSNHFIYAPPNSIYNIIYNVAYRAVEEQNQSYFALLNNAFFSMYRLELPKEDREAHTIIVAGSGSGKSELIKTMIFKDLKNPHISTVLIDPHGQLAPQVLNMKDKDNSKMVYVKPTLSDTQTPILNPFDVQFNTERELQNYLNFLIHTFEQTTSTESSDPQKELLEAGINAVFEMKGGLFELFGLFNDNAQIYDRAIQTTTNPIYKNILLYKWKTPQLNGTKSAIQRSINNFLKNIDFRDFTTGKSTIKLPYLLNNGYKVIFDLKGLPTPIADAIGRFITAQVTSLALSRNANGYNKPIYLYIDEFSRFMSPSIGNVLTEARKFGLHLVGAIQGIHGDEQPQIVNKLLSNTAIKIVGNCNYKNAQVMKNEISVDDEKIQKLKVGEFFIKTRKKEPFKFINPPIYLGDRYSVNSREKAEIIGQQLQKYYNTRFNTAQLLTSFLPTPSEERAEPNRQQYQQSRPKQEQSQRQEPQRPKEQPQTITATQPTPKAQKKPKQDDLSDLNFKTDLSL